MGTPWPLYQLKWTLVLASDFSCSSSLSMKSWPRPAVGHLSSYAECLCGGFDEEDSGLRLSDFQQWNLLSSAQSPCWRLGWPCLLPPESCLWSFVQKIEGVIQTIQKACKLLFSVLMLLKNIIFPSPSPIFPHTTTTYFVNIILR